MAKVLIVEDDELYRKIYKRKFEISGYTTEVAQDGQEGLDKMRSFRPDIVFVDLMMPKVDGFHFLDQAKADPTLKAIPVVVLTNLSTAEDAQKVMQKGAEGVLIKSDTDPGDVIEKAKAVLAK